MRTAPGAREGVPVPVPTFLLHLLQEQGQPVPVQLLLVLVPTRVLLHRHLSVVTPQLARVPTGF